MQLYFLETKPSFKFSIEIGVVFFQLFPLITIFYQKLLEFCLGIFWNCASEFFEIVSWNFSQFSSRPATRLQPHKGPTKSSSNRQLVRLCWRITSFCIFSRHINNFLWDTWCWEVIGIDDLVSRTNPPFSMQMLCVNNI
jgi:hypothetical protein